MTRTLAITGVSGFVGSHIARQAIASGWRVIGVGRHPPNAAWAPDAAWAKGKTLEFREIAGLDRDALRHALSDAEVVCHTAAYLPPAFGDPAHAQRLFEVNAVGTAHLLAVAAELGGKRVVYLSTLGAGAIFRNAEGAICEATPTQPTGKAATYLISKLAGEALVADAVASTQLSGCSLRLASVYGPGMSANHLTAKWLTAASGGETLNVHNGGLATTNLVHVGDVASATLAACEGDAEGLYHLAAEQPTTILELAQQVVVALGASADLVNVLPAETEGAAPIRYDIRRAATQLGWKPRGLKSGIADCIRQGRLACK